MVTEKDVQDFYRLGHKEHEVTFLKPPKPVRIVDPMRFERPPFSISWAELVGLLVTAAAMGFVFGYYLGLR